MNWPTHTDYQDAIQNPGTCFNEPELREGEAVSDVLGLPRVLSGNFASVYELKTAQMHWAIRCFVRQVSGLQARYARLSEHLSAIHLEYIVPFEYVLRGILIRGEWFPIVKMEWVDGLPLNQYVDAHLDPPSILQLAAAWRQMLAALQKLKLAHGDLQHGNIMVKPDGALRLVDYDGMYAPVFGRGRAPELGHINFQHPQRTAEYYDERLDDFSALVIFTSLQALAADPSLWNRFYTGDNLIFSSADFKAPEASAVFQQLLQSPVPAVAQLRRILARAASHPIDAVPAFAEIMSAMDSGGLEQLAKRPIRVAPVPSANGSKLEGTASQTELRRQASGTSLSTSMVPKSGTRSVPAPAISTGPKRNLTPWVVAAGLAVAGMIAAGIWQNQHPPPRPAPMEPGATVAPPPSRPVAVVSPPVQASPSSPKPKPPVPTETVLSEPLRTFAGHSGPVKFVTLSGDGKFLAGGGSDNTVRLWDPTSGALRQSLSGHTDGVESICFADNESVMTADGANVIRVWNASSGKLLQTHSENQNNLWSVALSPDGRLVAVSAGSRKLIRIATVNGGAAVAAFPEQASWVRAAAFSPDSHLLAVACWDDNVSIWQLGSVSLKRVLSVPTNGMDAVVFSPDNQWIASGAENASVKCWNIASGESILFPGHRAAVRTIAFSRNSQLLASGSEDGGLRIWDIRTGLCKARAETSRPVLALAFSGDDNLVYSGGADHLVRSWDLRVLRRD